MNKKEVSALISLLDDPDDSVFENVKERLLDMGREIIPELESAWEHSFDSIMQGRIEEIIHTIQFQLIKEELQAWTGPSGRDLLDGALILARYQYPDLNEKKVRKEFDRIKQDIWLELNNNLTSLEKIRVLNHIIFNVHGYSGNTTNYHAPQNSFINDVVETKKGNPLSLSVLYCVVANSLGIPIYGVNLPEHFILAYVDTHEDFPVEKESRNKILFYINPFSKGTVFGKKEIDSFLQQLKLPATEKYYNPCSNVDMIRRMINNLIMSFQKQGYASKAKELHELLGCLPEQ
jgi:regulator of sirC expression with transglutaminase-like and TPR domain